MIVPFSSTVLPSTAIGSAKLAMNESPGRLLSELTASIRATRKRVPDGMTTFGSGFLKGS
ncbi:MAG: hypothetical protein DMG17_02150 [Acidobacteria bacterium]|nr:MAG: hypothetical protein DMG17_02150 [Acidobacteriota bacterium]